MKKILKFFAPLTLLASTFLVSPHTLSAENPPKDTIVNHRNVKTIMEEHLDKNSGILDSSKNKDIIVFLGNTGSGKSTLINYLSGKELKVNDFNNIVLKNPGDHSAMAIGEGESVTSLPQFIQVGDLVYYDLPGFRDTRGTTVNLVNACFIKRIIENARSTKLVFVIGEDQITADRGTSFKELLIQAEKLLPGEKIENFSSLIINKCLRNPSKKVSLDEYLSRKISCDIPILKSWISKNAIGQMSQARDEIELKERESIMGVIIDMKPRRIKKVNIGAIYSTKDRHNIKLIYEGEIEEVLGRLYEKQYPKNVEENDIEFLGNRVKYFQGEFVKSVLESFEQAPLTLLLRPISKELYEGASKELLEKANNKLAVATNLLGSAIALKKSKSYESEAKELQFKRNIAIGCSVILPGLPITVPLAIHYDNAADKVLEKAEGLKEGMNLFDIPTNK